MINNLLFGLNNVMTCKGTAASWQDMNFLGACSLSWATGAILFFIVALSRRWIGEEMGWDYNFIGGLIGAYLPWLIIITIVGSYKFAFLGGIAGSFIGGFLGGSFFGGSEDG